MKRRQQDAQAKAAKHCSTENRQQEAQAIAAKHQSESLRSTRSAVPFGIVALVYSCSNIWCTHCNSNSCLYNMRTHNYPLWPMMTSVVMVLNLFLNLLQICIPEDNPDLVTVWWAGGSIPVWRRRPHDGAAWEQPCFPSDLTKIPLL